MEKSSVTKETEHDHEADFLVKKYICVYIYIYAILLSKNLMNIEIPNNTHLYNQFQLLFKPKTIPTSHRISVQNRPVEHLNTTQMGKIHELCLLHIPSVKLRGFGT